MEDIYINYMFANQLRLQRFTARCSEVVEAISGLLALITESSGSAVGPRRTENSKHSRELQASQLASIPRKKNIGANHQTNALQAPEKEPGSKERPTWICQEQIMSSPSGVFSMTRQQGSQRGQIVLLDISVCTG